jgi:hypothetical protein
MPEGTCPDSLVLPPIQSMAYERFAGMKAARPIDGPAQCPILPNEGAFA